MNKDSAYRIQPDAWVDRYADYLFQYTITRVSDEEVARDIIQDTFLAALKSAPNYQGAASERTWLIAILKRKIIDHYRRANSQKGKAEVRMPSRGDEENEGSWLENRVSDPQGETDMLAMENEELGLAIQDCISKLTPKQALVFTLKTIKGLETDIICNELEINPSNLWVLVHRARKTLMDCLNDNWFNT